MHACVFLLTDLGEEFSLEFWLLVLPSPLWGKNKLTKFANKLALKRLLHLEHLGSILPWSPGQKNSAGEEEDGVGLCEE